MKFQKTFLIHNFILFTSKCFDFLVSTAGVNVNLSAKFEENMQKGKENIEKKISAATISLLSVGFTDKSIFFNQ